MTYSLDNCGGGGGANRNGPLNWLKYIKKIPKPRTPPFFQILDPPLNRVRYSNQPVNCFAILVLNHVIIKK